MFEVISAKRSAELDRRTWSLQVSVQILPSYNWHTHDHDLSIIQ